VGIAFWFLVAVVGECALSPQENQTIVVGVDNGTAVFEGPTGLLVRRQGGNYFRVSATVVGGEALDGLTAERCAPPLLRCRSVGSHRCGYSHRNQLDSGRWWRTRRVRLVRGEGRGVSD